MYRLINSQFLLNLERYNCVRSKLSSVRSAWFELGTVRKEKVKRTRVRDSDSSSVLGVCTIVTDNPRRISDRFDSRYGIVRQRYKNSWRKEAENYYRELGLFSFLGDAEFGPP